MARVPVLSAQEVVRAFQALGWTVARSGNHIILVREGHSATTRRLPGERCGA